MHLTSARRLVLRRWFYFGIVNIAVMVTLYFLINLISQVFFGGPIQATLGNPIGMIGFCLVWGMAGSIISLMMSKKAVKRSMKIHTFDLNSGDPKAQWLVKSVHNMAHKAGLKKMPEVGIYESPELNAFATGPSKNNSLVAVSTGLLNTMNEDEVEGVLGHEVAHIANGDMVSMCLIQGVVNSFVLVIAQVISGLVSSSRGDDNRGGGYMMHQMIFMATQVVFGFLGSIITMYFSRQREFRADKGGAMFAGHDKMMAALKALDNQVSKNTLSRTLKPADKEIASLKISGQSLGALLRTHPKMKDRIARLAEIKAF